MSTCTDTDADDSNTSPSCPCLLAIKNFYHQLTPESLSAISDVYHSDVIFTDPAGSITGRDALLRHFERLLADTKQCRCDFADEQQIVSGDSALLCWRMTLQVPALAGGRVFHIDGASRLRYSKTLIIEHRDYFDLGQLLYEQLPLLGAVIRRLRRRMSAK